MKHLKKYKIFGSSNMMKLTKEELDKLSERDISDYRSEFIQRNNKESDFDQYLNELSLYTELRFEDNKKSLQKILDTHDPNHEPENSADRIDKLLFNVISREGGFDMLVNSLIDDYREKIGTPKFIFGI